MSNALLILLFFLVCALTTAALFHDVDGATLRPGVAGPERHSLLDDMLAVKAEFDRMLVRKGLVTMAQLELIRRGARSFGVVTAARITGAAREDCREVELDLMVKTLDGKQFPAQETAWIPASSLGRVSPGSVVDTYYRPGDRSAVAVHVLPG